jgi:hypothetical protein
MVKEKINILSYLIFSLVAPLETAIAMSLFARILEIKKNLQHSNFSKITTKTPTPKCLFTGVW